MSARPARTADAAPGRSDACRIRSLSLDGSALPTAALFAVFLLTSAPTPDARGVGQSVASTSQWPCAARALGGSVVDASADCSGNHWVVALRSGHVVVMRLSTLDHIRTWRVSQDGICAVAVGRTTERVAVGSGAGKVLLVDSAGGGSRQMTAASRGAAVTSLAFSADDRLLAAGRADGSVRLLELATGRYWNSPIAHRGPVASLTCAGHPMRVVSVDTLGRVVEWQHERGSAVVKEIGPVCYGSDMRVSRDGRYIARTIRAGGETLVHELGSAHAPRRFAGAVLGFASDRAIVAIGRGTLRDMPSAFGGEFRGMNVTGATALWESVVVNLFDIASGRCLGSLPGAGLAGAALSPDSTRILGWGDTGLLRLWQLELRYQ